MDRKCFLAANWKMNGSLKTNKELVLNIKEQITKLTNNKIDLIVCPPDVYLEQVKNLLDKDIEYIKLGTQNVSFEPNGAFTGQTSLDMLKDFDISAVIIGHSERRQFNNETDLDIAKKVYSVLKLDDHIMPILCVGETLAERESGETQNIIRNQITKVLDFLKEKNILDNQKIMQRLVVAYEPIWAIGTGKVATAEKANEVNRFIRELIQKISLELSDKVRIIYGGSVKSNNALDLISQPDIDGFLVGGASLNATEFVKIYSHMCN